MAYSTQRETSDGTLVLLSISIEYFDRTEIAVLFDGVVAAEGAGWDWVGSTETQISFSPAVTNGVEVMVVRTSDLAEIRHDLGGGAAFTNDTMDENFKQILHIAQEARENATIEDVFNDQDVHGYKVINVGNGVAAGDAVNVGQLTTHDATIVGYMNAADATIVGYMNAADASADAAAISAAAALVSATNAAGAVAAGLGSAIGTTVQAYDVDTAKTDIAQNFTVTQRSALLSDNDGSFDVSAKQNFSCTPTGAIVLTFTNQVDGVSGWVYFTNSSNYVVTAHTNTKITAADLAKLGASGLYRVDYASNGTKALCSVVGPY